MNKKQTQIIVVLIGLLFITVAADAKKWDKTDFDKLQGDDRVFHISNVELAVNGGDFSKSLDQELGIFLKNKDNTLPASLPLDELIKSVENKVGITIDKSAYENQYNDRMKNGFFADELTYNGSIGSYKWDLQNKKNRLAISIYIFKIGNRVRINKVQITIKLLKFNSETSEYEVMATHKSKRVTWKKQMGLYGIITDNCIVK